MVKLRRKPVSSLLNRCAAVQRDNMGSVLPYGLTGKVLCGLL